MELKEQLASFLEEAVQEAFTTTLSLEPERVEEALDEDEIISSIGFTGTIEGSLSLVLSGKNACAIVSKMIGMEMEDVDADVCDGVGEVTNIIIGGVKIKANAIGQKFEIGIPTTVRGQTLTISADQDNVASLMQSFRCGDIGFTVVLVFKVAEPQEGENENKPSGQKEEKPSALDLLNAAVEKAEKKEEAVAPKEEKPSALDLLNAAVKKAEGKEEATAPKEEKPSALDLLNAAVEKAEKKEETVPPTKIEEDPSVDQDVSPEEKNASESVGQEDETSDLKPLERLDLALKQFKELS